MSNKMFLMRKNNTWYFVFVFIWCLQMLTAVYFCFQKQGFHEDEYYTYYSTSRTYGLNIEDNAWMEHDTYFNEFVVLEGERFQYGLVKQVQSWDVHPPVYYWVFHTVASLFPGKFSKWYGLVVNLVAFGSSMVLLWMLCLKVTKNNEKLSLLVCFFYGFTPAVMSSVVFIRMYALLTVFALLCAVLHVGAVEEYAESSDSLPDKAVKLSVGKFLLPLAVVTYLGFLTQYYYFIFLFFMAVAFCVYLLWKDRNLWNCICYAVSLAVAFVLAYLTYPACLGQMFRGQRGAQATGNFFDVSNTLMRLKFFYQLLDEYVFGKMFTVLVVLIGVMLVFVVVMHLLPKFSSAYFILLFSVVGYFFVVSKTALLLGETSIRYQTPIYGMVVLFIFAAIDEIGTRCYRYAVEKRIIHANDINFTRYTNSINPKNHLEYGNALRKNHYNALLVVAALLAVIINISGLLKGGVVFLYPEDTDQIAFAREQSLHKIPVVYVYDENQNWCVWDAADEFFEYDRIYFVGQGSIEQITDLDIAGSKELIVYLSNTAQTKEQLERIMGSNPNLSDYELRYREKYCDVYYLFGGD